MVAHRGFARLLVAASLVATGAAAAQPSADKVDAKALMTSGVKLLEAKDYLGALAVFKSAFAQFPSARILLNIGTTLKLLDRDAEAANAYERYLALPDTDPSKAAEVRDAIAELDKSVGRLDITITPADAELQVDDGDWIPAAQAKQVRVKDGAFTVRARRAKYQSEAKSAHVDPGGTAEVAFALTAVPDEAPRVVAVPIDTGVHGSTEIEGPRSRVGAMALVHLDLPRSGGAAFVGITADATAQLQVQAAAILGPYYGGYGGASFAFLRGALRPMIAAGMPIFASHGARFAVRGAGGLEYVISRHLALILELGVEYNLNPEPAIKKAAFIPALGAAARL